MIDVIVVGGGPAGLSAALFCNKNGLETTVFDADETWMHKAHLYNYLGIRSMDGSVYMERARQHAVSDHGATIREEPIESVSSGEGGFVVSSPTDDYRCEYLVLATGADRSLAEELGCAFTDEEVVDVDVTMETSVPGAYATGAMVRVEEWQAIISAGDGAAAALNILSTEAGEPFHDFDVPD